MKNLLFVDIETFLRCFFIGIYIPEENKKYGFSVNQWENQLDSFEKFVESHKDWMWCGFNNLRFDNQILEWILRNIENWHDLSNLEICKRICEEADINIENANYGLFPRYRENELTLKPLDLGCIWHFFGDQKKTSLKVLEFSMCSESIEETPIYYKKDTLSQEEIKTVQNYCFNDIENTYLLYKYTIGETDHLLYKGQNKLLDRQIIEEETGLKCLNWDDVKIGAEWNKLDYLGLTGRSEKDLKPKKVNHFFGKKYKQFFPKTVKFQTKELQEFVAKLGETYITNKKQEFKHKFNDKLTVTIARGGIHSNEGPRLIKPKEREIYLSIDIGSQYPNAIRKYKIYPSHLGIEWNEMLVSKIERRLKYKKLAKETKDRKYESLQEMGKLSLNGGAYGRLNTQGDWQEAPSAMLRVTMGCQLEILMIAEDLILKGFNIISCNTDGLDVLIEKTREKELRSILTNFEQLIGNDVLGNFEYTEFEWIAQLSVNGYIAKKKEKGVKDEGVKKKKEFLTDFELHQNSSHRIIPLALEQYFVNNTSIDSFIRNHVNIYDFCIRKKASKDFHYEGISEKGTNIYKKLIRYYVSIKGEKLLKIKNESCITNAPKISQVEAGDWKCTVCNLLPKTTNPKDVDIDYSYYINKTQEIIDRIERGSKKKPIKQISNQMTLF